MAEQTRAPVVTILGHVDHGKTTLLDFIRKSAVAKTEHGGITQAIGAYQVEEKGKLITFIDTPGHAAFEKMRSRGAQMADITVLVVAVDDGVMPQTIEAIKHIQTAGLPMIVAVNKIDLPGVNIKIQSEKIKKQLSDQKVLVEEYGGDVPFISLSAKTGQGVDKLLENINLLSDIHEFKANPEKKAMGVVIESHLDKHKGPLATVLVRDGTLNIGDEIVTGGVKGKVKGMFDFTGKGLEVAGPSVPVEVLGFNNVPPVGSRLGEEVVDKGVVAKEFVSLLDRLKEGENRILNVVIKADKTGSLEAVEDILTSFNQDETHIKILSSATGDIIDSDVKTAAGTHGIVIGFNVKIVPTASKLAETEHVLIRNYNVIYELEGEIKDVVEGMLIPGKVEEVFGRAQILAEFSYGKTEKIAGCKVVEGTISKGPKIRLIRGEEIVGETKIKSLKKVKEEVNKVEKGMECGMMFDPVLDFQVGDIVESFRTF